VKDARASMYASRVFNAREAAARAHGANGGVVAQLSAELLFVLLRMFRAPHRGACGREAPVRRARGRDARDDDARRWSRDWIRLLVSVPGHPHPATVIELAGERGHLLVSDDALELELQQASAGFPAGHTRRRLADLPQPARFDLDGEARWIEDAAFIGVVSGGSSPPSRARPRPRRTRDGGALRVREGLGRGGEGDRLKRAPMKGAAAAARGALAERRVAREPRSHARHGGALQRAPNRSPSRCRRRSTPAPRACSRARGRRCGRRSANSSARCRSPSCCRCSTSTTATKSAHRSRSCCHERGPKAAAGARLRSGLASVVPAGGDWSRLLPQLHRARGRRGAQARAERPSCSRPRSPIARSRPAMPSCSRASRSSCVDASTCRPASRPATRACCSGASRSGASHRTSSSAP